MAKLSWTKAKGDSQSQEAQDRACLLRIRRLSLLDASDPRFVWDLSKIEADRYGSDYFRKLEGGVADSAADARKSVAATLKRWGGIC